MTLPVISTYASFVTGRARSRVEQLSRAGMITYGRLCGWTLARAHARSADRLAIAVYLGAGDQFDHAVADFAATYAEQNDRDYAALAAAAAAGRVQVASPPRR